jgi:transposase
MQASKLLSDEVLKKAESGFKRLGKYGVVSRKLQIIIAAKQHGITDVCRVHGISRTTLTKWIKQLSTEAGLQNLENKPKKVKSPLNQHIDTIKKWIEKNNNITAKELVIKVQDKLGVKTSMSSIYRLMEKLDFSYITPRPNHHKQQKETHEGFKKKSSSYIDSSS